MIKIINGMVCDPKTQTLKQADVYIADGKIAKISEEKTKQNPGENIQRVIDAEGKVVAPGLVDVHVHFRDPGFTYKEDIISGSAAAAHGGVTSVVLMANTKPVVDEEKTLSYVLEKGKKTPIHVYSCCSITEGLKGEKLTDFEHLLACGAAGFTDDGIPILNEEMTKKALELSAKYDTVLSFHEEDPQYIKNNGVNHGKASEYYGIGGSDRQAEISLVKRDLELAIETNGHINIQHISSKEAVELVRQAKKKSSRIHAEATPHHFSLTEEAVIEHGTLAKMNPPLRTEEDRKAIIEGLKDGTIDLIATDHAPHAKDEKEKQITQAPSGIIGLETSLALAITNLVDTKELTLPQLFEKMSYNPAKLYHLDTGYIAEGAAADLVIFDPKEKFVVGRSHSKSSNTPFTGQTLKGVIYYTICDGNIIFERKKEMQKQKEDALVLKQECLAEGIYSITMQTVLAKMARPGQFINIYPKGKDTMLPRPISICEADAEKNTLRCVYRVVGKGTSEFSKYKEGDKISVMGTLGNGFPLEEGKGKKAMLIGGGIGVPPILQLAKELDAEKMIVVGYRNNDLFLKEEFDQVGTVYVATEDGSAGSKGNVMNAIADNNLEADVIYACGPMPMLRAIKKYAEEKGIKAYISLEERMACGVGACLGCVAKTTHKDEHSQVNNARVCTDGPVFEAREVDI